MSQPGLHQTGNYVLLERIGMGGMAEVFRAASVGVEGFERPVAIKRILPNLAADEDFVKMFVDEAKIAVQLQHPNIVEIFDLARAEDDLFIAMEYVHGKDLRAILDKIQGPDGRGGRIPIEVAVHVTMKVCEALHHAHFAHGQSGQPLGIIHRDISPQNVIVSYDGDVKVTDFGLAKAAGRAVQTQAGVVKGKLAYMSPEQLRGLPIDQRSDVYGVGILLWEMLTGVRLFLGKNDQETLRKVYHAQVPPPRTVRPDIHPELELIVMRSLEREVGPRYGTAEEMQDDLTSFMYSVGPSIGTPGVGAFMRALFPNANPPAPPPSSHPPITARPRPAAQPEPAVTNAPPRRPREPAPAAEVSPPRPARVSSFPERTPGGRSPISLDDLEDLDDFQEIVESKPEPRVTRAVKGKDEGSELVRTVLHRAIASSTAQTRPPPPREEAVPEEDTNRGFQRTAPEPASPRQPHVFRRPGGADPSRGGSGQLTAPRSGGSGSLSAPRVPSIEALIEEALHAPDPPAHAPYAAGYPPQSYPQGHAPQAPPAPQGHAQPQGYAQPPGYAQPRGYAQPHGYAQPRGYAQPHGYPQPTPATGAYVPPSYAQPPQPQGHEHSVETDEFGDPPTMIGDESDMAGTAEADEGSTDGWDDPTTFGGAFDPDRRR
jgi:serine/threonine-protein kinase